MIKTAIKTGWRAVTSWIGSAPTIEADTTYEIDILDGVGICAEVS
ncbi:MAG: hypothetical protein WCR96_03255 [Candidatus Methanomethylophilaceae archaeon]